MSFEQLLRIDGKTLTTEENARHRGAFNAVLNALSHRIAPVQIENVVLADDRDPQTVVSQTVLQAMNHADHVVRLYRALIEEQKGGDAADASRAATVVNRVVRFDGEANPKFDRGTVQYLTGPIMSRKTHKAIEWAAAISNGLDPCTGEALSHDDGPYPTLYLHDGADDVKELEERYKAELGAHGMMSVHPDPDLLGLFLNDEGFANIRQAWEAKRFALIVIDALAYFIAPEDASDVAAVQTVLARLGDLAEETNACVLVIRDTHKVSE